jgi:hypothetical protein
LQALLFAIFLACPWAGIHGQAWSGIISPSRAIDWTQSGIPGGIPPRTTACATLNASTYGNGSSDATSGIQNALNSCGSGQAVTLSAGTFLIRGSLTVPANVTLRGDGADSTVLNAEGATNAVITLGGSGSPQTGNSVSVTSGATAGSTSIGVSSASGISAGMYLLITELNDSSFVSINGSEGACTWCDGGIGWNGARAAGQIVEVTSVNGTNIGIKPALYMTYSLTPLATRFTALAKYAGVENLQVFANNSGYSTNFAMNMCAYCWISGVEGNYTDGDHVEVDWSYDGVIQNSYFSNAYLHTSGSHDSDIDIRNKSTGMVIQNNILERLYESLMLEWGAAGNVIAYNYMFGNYASGSSTFLMDGINTHGAHPMFNLFEGNITQSVHMDSIWGSQSDNTSFRNWSKGTTKICSPSGSGRITVSCSGTNGSWAVQGNRAMDLDFLASSYNLVGDIIGSRDLAGLYHYNDGQHLLPQVNTVVSLCGPSPCGVGSRSYDAATYTYSFGFGESSDDGSGGMTNGAGCSGSQSYPCHSLTPYSTLFLHGEYSSATGMITWANGVTHSLPASFYLTSQPAWFGSVPWPAIGPDVTGGLNNAYGYAYAIPAELCYENIMGGTDGTNSPLTFNANNCYSQNLPGAPGNLIAIPQ